MTTTSSRNLMGRTHSNNSLSKFPLLSIIVPKDKQTPMRKLLKPFAQCVPIIGEALDVVEKDTTQQDIIPQQSQTQPPYSISGEQLSSPAIAIILVVPDDGSQRLPAAKSAFCKVPWRLHHKIQAQDKNSLNIIGSQEFHFMSRTYPLWSVISTPSSRPRLRINIFVRKYNAMVEFYRLITNSEIESQKPGFGVFPLHTNTYFTTDHSSHSQTDRPTVYELALKQCPHINPYQLHTCQIIFPVHNFESLLTLLQSRIQSLSPRHCLLHDPDGNPVVLYDISSESLLDPIPPTAARLPAYSRWTPDKISAHSESIDSGHFSDFDVV